MKRNPDAIREIMLQAEEAPAGQPIRSFEIESLEDPFDVAEHVNLALDSGLLEGKIQWHGREVIPPIFITRITNTGHDFIEAVRDDTIWKKVKENVVKPSATWTLGLILEYAKALAKERLGLP